MNPEDALRSTLLEELGRYALALSSTTTEQVLGYVAELERWGRKMNLTALSGRELLRSLVVEPIWIGRELGCSGVLMDIGSGNGSPAIPLALTTPCTTVHLVEARLKRAAFLRHVAATLRLPQVVVHRARCEELWPERFPVLDWITLRAVAPTADVLDALGRLSSSTTRVVWITSNAVPPVLPAQRFNIPDSTTEIWVFRLDQSWPV